MSPSSSTPPKATAAAPLGIQVAQASLHIGKSVEWKDGIVDRLTSGVAALLKKNGVKVIHGWAKIIDGKNVDVDGLRIQCEHLLLANGSQTVELPMLPFGGAVISSTEALAPTSIPKRLVVVGAGYIGLELGIAYRKLGSQVTVVEARERILPTYDRELTQPVADSLKALGLNVLLGHSVEGFEAASNSLKVRDPQGETLTLATDQGRADAGSPRHGPGGDGRRADCRQAPRVQPDGHRRRVFYRPGAGGGRQDTGRRQGRRAGLPRRELPVRRQRAGHDPDRKSVGRDNHLIVGWQAVGVGVSELAAAFGQSLEMGARLEDIAGTIHAHPTLGEAVQEAALKALGHALHI